LDRLLVALRRAFERLLPTPSQVAQQSTDVVRMVAHAEMTPDDLSHPFGGPYVPAEAMRFGSTDEQAGDLYPLVCAQPWLRAW